MILYLEHRRDDGEVDTYHLKPGRRYHIGRGSTCEVRLLDLKLSRQHAALEWLDGAWKLVDLGSTNGCRLDGADLAGAAPVQVGSAIQLGNTQLAVVRLADPAGDPDAPAEVPDPAAAVATEVVTRRRPREVQIAVPADEEPHPALVPSTDRLASPSAPVPAVPAPTVPADQDPAAGEATFFVTVQGRRIGPLTRAQARDLKVRDLRGDLSAADLDAYPQG